MSELKGAIGSILKNHQIENAAVAIIQDGLDYSEDFHADNVQPSENDRYLVYSIAKVFIAALIMRLSECRQIDLEEPVSPWFPEVAGLNGINIRLLLNHRSGLPDYGPTRDYLKAIVEDPLRPWSFEQYVSHTLEKGLLSLPGEKFNYSNLGYAFLKQLIQKATGVEFGEYLTSSLLKPLNLKNTIVLNTTADLALVIPALSYSVIPSGSPVDVRYHYHPGWVAHGLLASTAVDVARFLDQLFKAEIVSAASLKAMMEFIPVSFQSQNLVDPGYGLGLMTASTPHGRIFGHTGGGPGFTVVGYHLMSHRPVTLAVLTNDEMAFSLEKAMLELLTLTQS